MAVNIALLVITLAGPAAVAGFAVANGCPRLAAVTGITTAIYIGAESNEPFYSSLVFALLVLAGVGTAIRVGFLIAGR